MKRILPWTVLAGAAGILLLAIVFLYPVLNRSALKETRPWWKEAVFYEVFVRSFADSDGDGMGDFRGLTEKLDYLNDGNPDNGADLGVTALWLMPIHPSPSYHGYDVMDYYEINPDYGSMDDFQVFLKEAHRRGMRVIIDLVINHTSSRHPWFLSAQDSQSPYRNWYVFTGQNPGYLGAWNQQVWFPAKDGSYYYATFQSEMPDLNLQNRAASAEIDRVAKFWLKDVGVDGFRMDAVRYLVEEGSIQSHTDSTHAWLEGFHRRNKAISPDAVSVGEAWDTTFTAIPYAQDEQETEMVFNFELAERILSAVYGESGQAASSGMAYSHHEFSSKNAHYGTFLSNHDQNRVMTRFNQDVEKAKSAAVVYLTAPGTPFIYYGEEIGMEGSKPDERIRSPMQWKDGVNGGFTSGEPWEPLNASYADYNVEEQSVQPDSVLSLYRSLINLRREHAALRGDRYIAVKAQPAAVYAALRIGGGETLLVLCNLGAEDLAGFTLQMGEGLEPGKYQPEILLGSGEAASFLVSDPSVPLRYSPMPVLPAHARLVIKIK